MKLNVFNGGLNTRVTTNLVPTNSAVICKNTELFEGALRPLKDKTATPWTIPINDSHFTRFKARFVSGGNGTHFVEYNDALYKSDSVGTIKKSKDGVTFYELGLNKPSTALEVETRAIVFDITNITTGANIEFPVGKHTYTIGYETSATKFFKVEKTYDYQSTKGISIFKADIGVDVKTFKVYRKYEGVFYLVGESDEYGYVLDKKYKIDDADRYSQFNWQSTAAIRDYVYTYYSTVTGFESAPSSTSNEVTVESLYVKVTGFIPPSDALVDVIKLYRIGGSLSNYYHVADLGTISTEYNDTKTDLDVLNGDGVLTSSLNVKPPETLRFLTEYNNSLFACLDTQLWFSEPGIVDTWKENNWIQFPEHITGIGATQNGLLVFSRNKTWIIVGESSSSYAKYLLNDEQGCVTHNTIQYVANSLLWYSLDGICTSTGGNVDVLSLPYLGKLVLEPVDSCVFERQYYLFHDDGCIVADFRESLRFYELDLIVRSCSYISDFDQMFITIPGSIGLFRYNNSIEPLYMTYKSGMITEGELTNYKTYKTIYIFVEGEIFLSIWIDKVLVINKLLMKNEGLNEIQIPQHKTRGYGLEFMVEGTGRVLELENKVEGRKNGN